MVEEAKARYLAQNSKTNEEQAAKEHDQARVKLASSLAAKRKSFIKASEELARARARVAENERRVKQLAQE
eukprot:10043966-Lingulodinium_polyedra.AAC.1